MISCFCCSEEKKRKRLAKHLNKHYLNELLLQIMDVDYSKRLTYFISSIKFEDDLSFTVACDEQLDIEAINLLTDIVLFFVRYHFKTFHSLWKIKNELLAVELVSHRLTFMQTAESNLSYYYTFPFYIIIFKRKKNAYRSI